MKEDTSDKYTYSLAKNQVCVIIHKRDIRKNVLPGKLYKALYGDAMLVSFWGAQIQETDICFCVFLLMSEFIAWGTHQH